MAVCVLVCVRVTARSVHKTVLPVIYANTLNQPAKHSAQYSGANCVENMEFLKKYNKSFYLIVYKIFAKDLQKYFNLFYN